MVGLRIDDLVVEYSSGGNAIRPIDGLNLELDAGSLTILLGPSGCGKTTLLSCLGGLLTPTAGRITVGDVGVTGLSRRAMTQYRRRDVGIVFQAFNLVPSLTALENVMVPLRAAGRSRGQARLRAEELLTRVGLRDRMSHRPGDLSGGQQQRVAVARAIALDPPLILADEPTAHLDYLQVEEILRLIRELATGDRMVVVATHDPRLLPMADRVIEMVPTTTLVNRAHETIQLKAGTVLFDQGALSDLIYTVSEGELEMVRQPADGSQEVLRIAKSGDYFGEIGPLFGLPRSATVRARTDAVVTGYSVPAFRRQIGADAERGREPAMD
ncbi:antimicrobial peptide ABC transporter ATPase [Mycobacterium lentiflavum]|uniref:Antimicrobial peptide ABC transporter ATPase n=1 Tax=Mycobacterium lentiflavum TaxID=141349 RepID=A0A0E4GWG9_MYCLN|nr:ATP-binding cassette domain-containing protein [Mycobacterium lentiflavum]CQD09554.1 antimicrobial peptide ABC transporter ATPase [Mycobacterium lentiflavum]